MKANVHQTFDYASIGLRIKSARNKAGMTQDQFAEKLHISLELLIGIANALNVPIAELLADNLDSAEKSDDSDLRYILLDCTAQEEKIITKAAKALKAILSEHGV